MGTGRIHVQRLTNLPFGEMVYGYHYCIPVQYRIFLLYYKSLYFVLEIVREYQVYFSALDYIAGTFNML